MRYGSILLLVAACGPSHATTAASVTLPLPTVTPASDESPPRPARARPLPSGTVIETREVGGTSAVVVGRMVLDASGNGYVVGSFSGTVTFGDLPPITAVEEDAFVLKLDATRKPEWVKRIGGDGLDYGDDVAVDASGAVYVSGAFESKVIDLGKGPLRCAGIHDLFLARYQSDGSLVWAKRYGDALDQISLVLRAHPAGGVVATGWYNGTIDFGAGPIHGVGTKASFVARIEPDGHALWSRAFGHRIDFADTDSAVTPDGHVWVVGGSEGTSEFVRGGAPSAKNDLGPVWLELDASGKLLDARRFGSGADNIISSIGLAADGLRFASLSPGAINFGDHDFVPPQYERQIVLADFTRAHSLVWSRQISTGPSLHLRGIVVDASGNTYLASQFRRMATQFSEVNVITVTKVDASGTTAWTRELGDAFEGVSAILLDATGNVVVAGSGTRGIAIARLTP